MEAHTFLLQLLIILVAARVIGELVAAVGVPSVIGELVAGIIIGPSLLGWVEPNDLLRVLAEVGVILLLFEVAKRRAASRSGREHDSCGENSR